jgi:hypothetical protein
MKRLSFRAKEQKQNCRSDWQHGGKLKQQARRTEKHGTQSNRVKSERGVSGQKMVSNEQ